MKRKQLLEQADLDRKEWCFTSIRKTELEACYLYEYWRELARESARTEGDCGTAFKDLITFWLRWRPVLLHKDCDPNIPWQELDQKVRSVFAGLSSSMYVVTSIIMEPERESHVTNITEFRHHHESWQKNEYDLERTEYGFFAINWRFADREIKRRFAQWLSEQREEVEAGAG